MPYWNVIYSIYDTLMEIALINFSGENKQLLYIKKYKNGIQFLLYKRHNVQLASVNKDGLTLRFIRRPGPDIALAAVIQNEKAFEYIKDNITKIYIKLLLNIGD